MQVWLDLDAIIGNQIGNRGFGATARDLALGGLVSVPFYRAMMRSNAGPQMPPFMLVRCTRGTSPALDCTRLYCVQAVSLPNAVDVGSMCE